MFDTFLKAIYKGEDPLTTIPVEKTTKEHKDEKTNLVTPQNIIIQNTTIDPEYIIHFEKFLTEKNIPGPDYFEFATTLHEMDGIGANMTEQQKFQATYMGFKVQNVSAEALSESGKSYLKFLQEHKSLFEQSLQNEKTGSVIKMENEIQSLDKANTDAMAKITELQNRIVEVQNEMTKNKEKIGQNKIVIDEENKRIENKKGKFESAFKVITNSIQQDIDKISLYLSIKK
ncbi:MAG: hypothetical protein H7X71_05210 [Chitinophagales bacterium]|nr:hypothetical protein [Chitinophagales bacterium]